MEEYSIKPDEYYLALSYFKDLKRVNPKGYHAAITVLQKMAKGDDVDDLRSERFPEWEDEQLQELLADLGEEY